MPRSRVVVALVLVLVGLAACGGGDSGDGGSTQSGGSGSSTPTVYSAGDSISVAEGSPFVVELEANPTTGYTWTAADNPNATFVESRQVTSSTLPGAPGMQQLTFEATATGSSTLTLSYARSFEPDEPPVQTESFPLTVT